MMEQEEIKRKLLGLWEKTTHNSKELLSTLFDYYFDINYIEYKEVDGKIVSAICGIPYAFGYGENQLKGIYLLPLSSEEGFRKKGILAELLNNFNNRIKEDFDFSFILPHTALLADYFGTLGFLSSFFILEERFTPLHNFKNDYILSLVDSDDRIRNLKTALFDDIKVVENCNCSHFSRKEMIDFIQEIERKSSSAINMVHTEKDLDYILHEEDTVIKRNHFVAFDNDGKITGIAFTKKEDMKHTKVVAYYVSDICSYYVLLDFIKRWATDHSLSIVTSDPKFQTIALIQHSYSSSNPNGGDLDSTISTVEIPFNVNKLLQPEGMVKLLRFDNILNYITKTRRDIEFRLHIRDFTKENKDSRESDFSKKIIYIVKNGNLTIEKVDELPNDRTLLNLSTKEISELLLRKNDSSNLVMEAFGIPRLNLQIRLLPC